MSEENAHFCLCGLPLGRELSFKDTPPRCPACERAAAAALSTAAPVPPIPPSPPSLAYEIPRGYRPLRVIALPREWDTPIGMILLIVIPQTPRTVLFVLPAIAVLMEAFHRGEWPGGGGWIVLGHLLIGPAYLLTLFLRLVGLIRGRSAFDGLAVLDIFLAVVTCLWPFYDRMTAGRSAGGGVYLLMVAGYAILTALIALAIMQTARYLPRRPGEPE